MEADFCSKITLLPLIFHWHLTLLWKHKIWQIIARNTRNEPKLVVVWLESRSHNKNICKVVAIFPPKQQWSSSKWQLNYLYLLFELHTCRVCHWKPINKLNLCFVVSWDGRMWLSEQSRHVVCSFRLSTRFVNFWKFSQFLKCSFLKFYWLKTVLVVTIKEL
jgi:hypothetical protein